MGTYWITFRLKDDASYEQRYNALVAAVDRHRTTGWWFEPTAFWIVGSASSQAQLAASVAGAIDPRTDLALIGAIGQPGTILVGAATERTELRKLVPQLTVR